MSPKSGDAIILHTPPAQCRPASQCFCSRRPSHQNTWLREASSHESWAPDKGTVTYPNVGPDMRAWSLVPGGWAALKCRPVRTKDGQRPDTPPMVKTKCKMPRTLDHPKEKEGEDIIWNWLTLLSKVTIYLDVADFLFPFHGNEGVVK